MKVPIIKKCAGINNILDPKRLRTNDRETGLTDLATGVDIDIDDSGQIACRLGQVEISTTPGQVFCDGGDCFAVQDRTSDSAIYQVQTNFTLSSPIVTGLTKGEFVSWFQAGDKTYYSNGTQHGRIVSSVGEAWPANTATNRTTNVYSDAPIGTHIAYFLGRAWIAVDDTIYCSTAFRLGRFRFAKYFFRLGSTVRMIRPVAGGVWVSDAETTGFITSAQSWDGYKYTRKSSYPAHEWSDNQRLVDLGKSNLRIPGMSAVWSSDEGLCIGTAEGQLIISTKDRLVYPTGARGATVVFKDNVINTIY